MNKKLLLMPIAVLSLGIITGCNKDNTVTTNESDYFFDSTNVEFEKKLEISADAKNIELGVAQTHMTKALAGLSKATYIKHNYFKNSKYDSVVNTAKNNRISIKPSGKTNDYKVIKSLELIPHSNHVLEANTNKDESLVYGGSYKKQYVKEKNDSVLFAKKNDTKIAVYNKETEEYLGNKATNFYENYTAEVDYDESKEAVYNKKVDDVFDSNKTYYADEINSGYRELNKRIQDFSSDPETKTGRITKEKGNVDYYYCHCPYIIDLEEDQSVLYNYIFNSNELSEKGIITTVQQGEELKKLYTNSVNKGITFIINPAKVLNLDDLDIVGSLKANYLRIFDYFLPVNQKIESLFTITDDLLTNVTYKYSTSILKNENGDKLKNPISYSSEYASIDLSYKEKTDYDTTKLEFDVTRKEVPYTVSIDGGSSTYNELKDTSIYDWAKLPEQIKTDGIHVISGYIGRGNAESFLLNVYPNFSTKVKTFIGFNNITSTNVTVSEGHSNRINWPTNATEAQVLLYLDKDGSVYTTRDGKYGLTINFYFE